MANEDIKFCAGCEEWRMCGAGFIARGVLLNYEADKSKEADPIEFEAVTLLMDSDIQETIDIQRGLHPECSLTDEDIRYNIASTQ